MMNTQYLQLTGALLQLIGWAAPVIVIALLLFRFNARRGVGVGGAHVLVGGVVMILVLLFKAFLQYQFGLMNDIVRIISQGIFLAAILVVARGAMPLLEFMVKNERAAEAQREKKKIVILLGMAASIPVLSNIIFALIDRSPVELMLFSVLYNANISIAACLYLAFGMLWRVQRPPAALWHHRFFFCAFAALMFDGVLTTSSLKTYISSDAYLWTRAILGAVTALIGVAAVFFAHIGSRLMIPALAPIPVKDSILHYKLGVQKRFVMILTISLLVISATGYLILEVIQSSRHSIENTFLNEQRKVAENVAVNIEGINSALLNSLSELARRPGVQDIRPDSMRVLCSQSFFVWKNVAYSISRIDENGILRYVYPEVPGIAGSDINYQLHIKRFLSVKDTIISGEFKSLQGMNTFGMYVPVYARNRTGSGTHFAGAIAILIRLDAYGKRAFRNTWIFTPNPLAAVNSFSRVIVSTRESAAWEKISQYLPEIFPGLTNRDSIAALTKRISTLSSPAFIKVVTSTSGREPQWLVAHPLRFAQKPLGVVILPVSDDQISSIYSETVGKQMIMWGLFALVLVVLMSTVVIIFYRWSRFLEEEVKHEVAVVREAEGKYAQLFNEAVVGIFRADREGLLIGANPSMAAMLAYPSTDELLASDVFRAPIEDDATSVPWDEIKKKAGEHTTVAIKKGDGSVMTALVHCKAVSESDDRIERYEGFIQDITERKHLEQQLIQAQKLEGIGTLAGGIAHDFNNLLAMILGSAELMQVHSQEFPQLKKYVDRIIDASERGASISRQLLIFSRPDQAELKPVSVAQLIRELEDMLNHFLPKSVSVETRLHHSNGIIMGDAGHLHQALLNLSINASDAMPKGGSLVISENCADRELMQKKFPSCGPGPYIAITVSDTGMGMDETVLAKMFDPFFSTKERGKGTGLGLAIVHGIVKSHHGYIDVESVLRKGTVFTLYFPALESAGDAEAAAVVIPQPVNNETIMIVDDEALIRDMLGEHLAEQGYSVFTAADGKEALEIYAANGSSISLVITDLGMPEMGGEDLFHRLKAIDPNVKVMVSSGYLTKATKDSLLEMGILDVLTKPYRLEIIQTSIHAILNQHQ